MTYNGIPGWYFVETWANFGSSHHSQSGGCGSIPLDTYTYTNGGTSYVLATLNAWGDVISQTHLEADLSTTNTFGICGQTNIYEYAEPYHMTVDLENEYTDGELYTNIMSLMPAYPSDWYTPVGNDFLLTCAYSIIHMNHVNGPFGGWGFYAPGAELQKMKYRFCVPGSDIRYSYAITWDVITYNFTTGAWSKESGSTNIFGTGAEAYSGEYYAPPPDWDQSEYHGFVFRWVDNVKVTATPLFQKGSVAGSGPWKSFSHDGSGCGSCAGSSGAGGFHDAGGISAEFSMGQASNGFSAQSLKIDAAFPSLSLATPAGLAYTAYDPSIEVIQVSSQLRQVKAPQALADIVTLNAFSYEIRYYLPSQVGSLVSGVYQVTGSPFVTWKIENPDASTTVTNRLRLTETRGADAKVYDYTYTTATGSWKLLYPGSLREDEWTMTVTTNGPSTYFGALGYFPAYLRTITNTVRVPGGATQSKVKRVYQQFSWGEGLVEETLSPDSNPETTTYAYHDYNSAGTTKPLKLVVHPDGSWKYYDPRDGSGRLTAVYSGFGDTPAPTGTPDVYQSRKTTYDYTPVSGDDGGTNEIHTPRTTIEYVQGNEVARRYAVILTNAHHDIQAQSYGASWDAADNLVTITKYYSAGSNTNRVQSIERPDGTMAFYEYAQAANGGQTNTVYSGQPNGGKTAIVDGTKEVTILGPFGEMISRTVTDVASSIVLGSDTYSNYDSFSRPTRVTHLDGTYEDTQYACCGVDTTTDRDGVVTFYKYDAMKRQTATVRHNVTSTNVLDAAGRTVKSIRIGTDASQIVLGQSGYNLAGELTHETNALNGVTSYIESVDGSGHKVRTTTNPDGGTRIETYYLDGSLLSVTGTAEYPVYYEYGVEWGTAGYATYTKEFKGSATGDEWTKTYADMLGRSYKTIYADETSGDDSDNAFTISYYNTKGQMTNQVDPDGVATLYQYNAKGELEYTAVDVNQDGVIDFSGMDRITRTVSDVLANYSTNVRRTRSYVWKTDNSNTSTLVSTMESSTDGLRSWNTAWNNGQGLTNRSQTVFGGSGYRYSTNTAPDNSYSVSITRYGTNVSSTRFDSTGSQLLQMTFAYDTHGRQNCITDARNGTTTNWFNAADQVSSTRTPVPTTGQSAQVTTNYFDTSLRVWKTTLPDSTSVTNEFFLTGMLKKTYGSRTYPVEYTYDYAGRMATMKTWQNFANNSGAAITAWNYDIYRGWLTNKLYADSTGPGYTYTLAGRMETRTWARPVSGSPLVTIYSYNDAGDMDGVDYSDSTPDVTYTYDRLGRQKTIAHNSITTTLTYNDAGLVLTESYSGGTLNGLSVTNGYDQYLRRTNLTALNGSTVLARTAYGYDTASRLKTVADGVNTTAYGYLANSPLVGNVWFTNNATLRMTTTKSYDFLNRLTALTNNAGGSNVAVFNYANNTANQRTSITNVDSSRWIYQYDALGQVVSGKKYWSDGTPVAGQQFEYGFDDIGNRKTTAAGGDAMGANLRYASYSANNLNQYTSRDVPGFVNVLGTAKTNATVTLWGDNGAYSATSRKGEYFRGELGVTNPANPVWLTITNLAVLNNGTNADIVTNAIGKAFIPKTAEVFGYDLDGNLTNDGRWTYSWDAENRLVQQESLSGAPTASKFKLEFAYDSKGRRIQKLVSTNNGSVYVAQYTNRFVYDGWNLVGILAPNSSLLSSFTWGLDLSGSEQGAGGVGGLLMCRDAGMSATNFVAYDGNGNVAAFVNATNGAVTAQYEYGPFGEVLRTTGASAKANPFRFSTKYQDDESDYLYYGYRSYNPSTGRWLNRDPIAEGGGANLYQMVANNPVSKIDLHGLVIICCNPEGYFKENGITEAMYVKAGNTYSAKAGASAPNTGAGLILWRMLLTSHTFKVLDLDVKELRKHVNARLKIVDNALKADFAFEPSANLTREQFQQFTQDPEGFFERINATGVGLGCSDVTMLIFESGNKLAIRDQRKRDGIWIPGDWGYIRNMARERNPSNWKRGFEGENLIHTGINGNDEMFWGHFAEGVHDPYPEKTWFDDIKNEWPKNGSLNGELGDPVWKDWIRGPGVGIVPNFKP